MESAARQTGPITYKESIDAARKELAAAAAASENLLMPSDSLNNIPAMHKVTVERIKLSPDPQDKDVYIQQGKDDDPDDKKRYALTKEGLLKLSACAGVQWDYDHSARIDDQRSANYIAWRMVGAIQRLDGSWLPLQGAYDLDMDVIEEQIIEQKRSAAGRFWANAKWYKAMTKPEQEAYILTKSREDLLQVKRHKVARCETGAMLRAIRGLLNVKGTYTHAEIQKPFVLCRLVFQPDYADPFIKAQAVQLAFQAMQGIYGPGGASPFQTPQRLPGPAPIDLEETDHGSYARPEDLDPRPTPAEPEPPPGETEIFADHDKETKIRILNELIRQKAYDTSKLPKPLEEYGDESKLIAFYEKLIELPDVAVDDDDIPF